MPHCHSTSRCPVVPDLRVSVIHRAAAKNGLGLSMWWKHLSILACCLSTVPLSGQTIAVSLPGQSVEGKPVHWDDSEVTLLLRDGRYLRFAPSEARGFRQVSRDFSSYSQSAMRGQLLREFGREYDVSGTGQYLVVHPTGQKDLWADRFERLYRSMVHYFTARGFAVRRPEFPLVAVVFPTQSQYVNHLRQSGVRVSAGSLGYYDPATNRICLFDVTAEGGDARLWYLNAETIIHEAAHQTAFNIGIHPRVATTPTWIVEGIGTMFEAPGVWDAQHHQSREDRINGYQLKAYRQLVPSGMSPKLLQLQLASDRLFAAQPDVAYAHAWALTFFLTEQEPRQLARYLQTLERREPFREYTQAARLQDFTRVFGSDLQLLDARLQRFLDAL